MIRVTVELLPFGSERDKQELGCINIVNDGTGDREVGNYDVSLTREGRGGTGIILQHARITGHRRSDGWRSLLAEATELLS